MNDPLSPLVTTVIPTWRRPRLLRRAVQSALEQDLEALRVCVFDNDSGDGTAALIAELAATDPRLRYHAHASNIGAIANFEFGIGSVDTPYFSILSDDDYLLPGFYRRALAELELHPQAMFWAGATLNVDEQNRIWDARVARWPEEGLFEPPQGVLRMTGGLWPTWTGILFRREVLAQVGLPDREALGPFDLDFVLKIGARFPYIVRRVPVAVFTLNSASFGATQPLSSFWPGWKKMFRNLEQVLADVDEHSKNAVLSALHRQARRMLFRRGANALAAARLDFARDAARALQEDYGKSQHAGVLRGLALLCANSALAQGACTRAYRFVENRLIEGRQDLHARYAHLIRPA